MFSLFSIVGGAKRLQNHGSIIQSYIKKCSLRSFRWRRKKVSFVHFVNYESKTFKQYRLLLAIILSYAFWAIFIGGKSGYCMQK